MDDELLSKIKTLQEDNKLLNEKFIGLTDHYATMYEEVGVLRVQQQFHEVTESQNKHLTAENQKLRNNVETVESKYSQSTIVMNNLKLSQENETLQKELKKTKEDFASMFKKHEQASLNIEKLYQDFYVLTNENNKLLETLHNKQFKDNIPYITDVKKAELFTHLKQSLDLQHKIKERFELIKSSYDNINALEQYHRQNLVKNKVLIDTITSSYTILKEMDGVAPETKFTQRYIEQRISITNKCSQDITLLKEHQNILNESLNIFKQHSENIQENLNNCLHTTEMIYKRNLEVVSEVVGKSFNSFEDLQDHLKSTANIIPTDNSLKEKVLRTTTLNFRVNNLSQQINTSNTTTPDALPKVGNAPLDIVD